MRRCPPSFSYILKKDKSTVFLTAVISFYLALVICLPFNASFATITVTTVAVSFPLSLAYQYLKDFSLKLTNKTPISFWYFFVFNIGILSIYFYATYPGCIQFDEIYQWEQIQRIQFDDWHSALHSMLIWCLTRICNKFQFVLIFQGIIFSLLISSLCYEISKLGLSKKLSKWMFFLTIFSPATCSLLMTLLKDVSFAMTTVGLTEIFILTYFSKGKWIQTNFRTIILGILLSLASIFRHNGILYTIPFSIVLIYFFRNKYTLRACIIAVCLTSFIKIPLYSYLKVTPHSQVQAELCGLPMTVLSEIFVKNSNILDLETKVFMLSLADQKTWETNYKTGSWNSIKSLEQKNMTLSEIFEQNSLNSKKLNNKSQAKFPIFTLQTNQRIIEFTPQKVCLKALKFGIHDSKNTLNALINLTGLIWKISFSDKDLSKIHPLTVQNISKYIPIKFKIDTLNIPFRDSNLYKIPSPDSKLKGTIQMAIIVYSLLLCVFWRPGLYLLLLILSAFFSFKRLHWKSFFIISPILVYNLGTLITLCGHNDFRFLFCETLITFPYMFLLFAKKQNLQGKPT